MGLVRNCSKTYLAANGMLRSLDELNDHPVLSYPEEMIKGVKLMKWLDQFMDKTKIVITVDSVITMSASP